MYKSAFNILPFNVSTVIIFPQPVLQEGDESNGEDLFTLRKQISQHRFQMRLRMRGLHPVYQARERQRRTMTRVSARMIWLR